MTAIDPSTVTVFTTREVRFNHGQNGWYVVETDLKNLRRRSTAGVWDTLDAADDGMWDDECCGKWDDWEPLL